MSEEKKTQLSEAFYAQDDTVVLEKMNTTTDGLCTGGSKAFRNVRGKCAR